ncbi:glycine zipper 2TM domain-containing protein [Massilia sp. MS-15]|uniref:glycine zipper 2TM domain-containing protein n=1 Tax=Massilia sp. MS-15 TaxID=2878200 RepID=UPI001CD653ED|nr:glycine zipper 2TM domain-containing protein [Massilia sp. MS-15]MCA1245271.1 glycine zipper 2TM domain-containing protein [Massilia sp. MS-15]
MYFRKLLQAVCAALLALGPLAMGAHAQAQSYQSNRVYTPIINGFNVEEVRRLTPGVELHFELYGTPGGSATLRIDGATRNLNLTEVEPGQYSGTYIIGTHDRIRPESGVTANLRLGNQVATSLLRESLLRANAPRSRSGQLASMPAIERFEVQGSPELSPGNELRFTVFGTPGGRVEVAIAGARGVFFLPEVRPGEYDAVYTIRGADRIAPDSRVTATIRANGRYTTSVLGRPLLGGGRMEAPRQARYCSNCAVVETVNVIEVSGNGSYLGTVGGAVVGGLLGSQVGSGSGRTAASVAGAVAGGIAGRNIERNMHREQRYEVVVRYTNSGALQTLQYENDPGFRQGDRVRVNKGVLVRDQ